MACLYITEHGWKWLQILWLEMVGNGFEWLKMTGHDWNLLEMARTGWDMVENSWNLLEIVGKWIKITGHDWKWLGNSKKSF